MTRHRIVVPSHGEPPADLVATVQMLAQAVVVVTKRLAVQEAQIAKLAAQLAALAGSPAGKESCHGV